MATITTISIKKEDLTLSIDLPEDEENEKYVPAQDLLLAAFRQIDYFYSQNALIKAYYNLDPDTLGERDKSDPVRKYMPDYVKLERPVEAAAGIRTTLRNLLNEY